jgi:hypothetical protein
MRNASCKAFGYQLQRIRRSRFAKFAAARRKRRNETGTSIGLELSKFKIPYAANSIVDVSTATAHGLYV